MIAVVLAAQLSCTGTSSGIRMEQASDGLTSGGNLAMVAVRATALAAVRQPVTTTKLGLAVLWHRPREVVGANIPVSLKANSASREAPGTTAFEESLDRMNAPAPEMGKLRWLVDGPAFFHELDHRIEAARHSIKLQVFIFDNDDIGVRYADRLKRRSSEIPVHVLFDDLGNTLAHLAAPKTSGPPGFVPIANMAAYLRKDSATGARRTLSPWLACDHTKLIVFDHNVAIVGGMNIGREYYSEWHDLMVRVEGPIVRSLLTEFDRAWRRAGPWGDFARRSVTPKDHRPPIPIAGAYPLRILRTDPAEGPGGRTI